MFSLLLYLSNWCNKFLFVIQTQIQQQLAKQTNWLYLSKSHDKSFYKTLLLLSGWFLHTPSIVFASVIFRKPGDIINISSGCNDDVICLTGSCSVINMQIRWHQGIPPPDDGDSTEKSDDQKNPVPTMYFHRIECIGVWRCCKSSVWILSRMNENLTTLMCQSSQLSGFGEVQDCIGVRDTVTMHCWRVK